MGLDDFCQDLVPQLHKPLGKIDAASLNIVASYTCYLLLSWSLVLFIVILSATLITAKKIYRLRQTIGSFSIFNYLYHRLKLHIQSTLAIYFSDNPYIQSFIWFLLITTSMFAFPIAQLTIGQMILYIATGHFEIMNEARSPIVGEVFHLLFVVLYVFLIFLLQTKQYFLYSRPDLSTRIDFTKAERMSIVKLSMRRTLSIFLVGAVVTFLPIGPSWILEGRAFESNPLDPIVYVFYYNILGAAIVSRLIQIRRYLVNDPIFIAYQSACGKADLMTNKLINFLENYNPRIAIRNIEAADFDEFSGKLKSRLPLFFNKLSGEMELINVRDYLAMPRNLGDVGQITKIYLVTTAIIIANFCISTLAYFFAFWNVPFVILTCSNLTVTILGIPFLIKLMLYSQFVFGKPPKERESEMGEDAESDLKSSNYLLINSNG